MDSTQTRTPDALFQMQNPVLESKTIEVPLGNGTKTIVDELDAELVSAHRWVLLKAAGGHLYAVTYKRNPSKAVLMHRLITSAPRGFWVDHINFDGLDNRRNNLRICTCSQNMMYRRKLKEKTSRFKGVSLSSHRGLYVATIQVGKSIHLGRFKSEEEAALAYDEAARKYFGDFAWLNFPLRLRA